MAIREVWHRWVEYRDRNPWISPLFVILGYFLIVFGVYLIMVDSGFEQILQLIKQPWFAQSPSPFSFGFYIFAGILGAIALLKQGAAARYKNPKKIRWLPWIFAFVEALTLVILVVLIQDTIWLLFNTTKWILPYYSDVANFSNYYVRFAQNFLGMGLMIFLSWDAWKAGAFKYTKFASTGMFCIVIWLFLQFLFAPNQAYTDWMFAVAYGYPDWLILQGFLLNIGMKSLLCIIVFSIIQKRKSIPNNGGNSHVTDQIEDKSKNLFNNK